MILYAMLCNKYIYMFRRKVKQHPLVNFYLLSSLLFCTPWFIPALYRHGKLFNYSSSAIFVMTNYLTYRAFIQSWIATTWQVVQEICIVFWKTKTCKSHSLFIEFLHILKMNNGSFNFFLNWASGLCLILQLTIFRR